MTLIIMKFLAIAHFGILFVCSMEGHAGGANFDLERIQTLHGRTYREIQILGADQHGLTFRHRDGIAKIEFASLSDNIRMLYEIADEMPPSAVADESDSSSPAIPGGEEAGGGEQVLTIYHRLTLYTPAFHQRSFCSSRGAMPWPSVWPRFHPAHLLTIPCHRELAVRDFLILSGLSGGGYHGFLPSYR